MFGIGVCSSLEEKWGSQGFPNPSQRPAVGTEGGRQAFPTGLARRAPTHFPITPTDPPIWRSPSTSGTTSSPLEEAAPVYQVQGGNLTLMSPTTLRRNYQSLL